jgi:replication-associated recombination protein RarA
MRLFERVRPQLWADVVGQDKAVTVCRRFAAAGVGGRAFYLVGGKGTGKSTIAELLAREIADPLCIEELDAARLTPSRIDEIERQSAYYGMGVKTGRAYVVNECHLLSGPAIGQLLVTLDTGRIPGHVVWIFTTTNVGEDSLFGGIDAGPLVSRCHRIRLARQGLAKPFAEYARRVAVAEGLDGRPDADYVKLAERCKNDLREMLMEVESGAMLPD